MRVRSLLAGVLLVAVCVGLLPHTAGALVPLPQYACFVKDGSLQRVLAGDTAPEILVDRRTLPEKGEAFTRPFSIVSYTWSADGTRLAMSVESGNSGTRRVFLANHNGDNLETIGGTYLPLGDNAIDSPVISLSPDGDEVAIVLSLLDSPFGSIEMRDIETDRMTDIGKGIDVTFSPDGTKLLYVGAVDGVTTIEEKKPPIMVYDIETEEAEEIARGIKPRFSPDGTTVAYVTWDGDGSGLEAAQQLAVVGVDGTNPLLLTEYGPLDDMGGPSMIREFEFSEDGESLYFLLGRRSDSRGVWKVPVAGGIAPEQVVPLAEEFALVPDGGVAHATGGLTEGNYQTKMQVFVTPAGGGEPIALCPEELADSTCENVSVSPESGFVVFDAIAPGGMRSVWTNNVNGSGPALAADDARLPSWQPNLTGEPDEARPQESQETTEAADSEEGGGFFAWISGIFSSIGHWFSGLFD